MTPPGLHLVFDDAEFFGGFPLGWDDSDTSYQYTEPLRQRRAPVMSSPADTVNLAARVEAAIDTYRVATIRGQEFQGASLNLVACPFQAGGCAPAALDRTTIEVTVPFSMVGDLSLFGDQARTTLLLSDTISGRGEGRRGLRRF